MPNNANYSKLLDLVGRLIDAQTGNKIEHREAWLNDAQNLAVNLFSDLVSMQTVATPANIEFKGGLQMSLVDHSSAKVIRLS